MRLASAAPCTVGFGSLVFDQILTADDTEEAVKGSTISDRVHYVEGRGGGSIWNVLANLAAQGVPCSACGWGGDDEFGEQASSELLSFGVDVSGIVRTAGSQTRVIFEIQGGRARRDHLFTDRCPVCGSKHTTRLAAHREQAVSLRRASPSVLIVDDLNGNAAWELMTRSIQKGDLVAAVLDHPSSYRYTPISKIISRMKALDVIFMKDRVYDSFRRRAIQAGFGDLKQLLVARDRTRVLVSTRGAEGAEAWINRPGGEWVERWVAAPDVPEPFDTSGAGDAFFASFLVSYLGARFERLANAAPTVRVVEHALKNAADATGSVLMARGARGHLPAPTEPSVFRAIAGKSLGEIRESAAAACPLCLRVNRAGVARKREKRLVGMKETGGSYLRSRILFSLDSAPFEQAAELLRERSRTYVVGTGGSYPAAAFIAYTLTKHGGHHAEAMKPHELIARGGTADTIVIVSSSGKTYDCLRALMSAAKHGAKKCILVTSTENPKLVEYARGIIPIEVLRVRGRDRGFVSFVGTMNPAVLFAVAAGVDRLSIIRMCERNYDKVADIARQWADRLLQRPLIHAVGTSWSWPALLDLESKFTEGNLGTVHLHEAKDFSHGRFMRILNSDSGDDPVVLFRTGERDAYVDLLSSKLATLPGYGVVSAKSASIMGALELMLATQTLVLEVASILQKDISRPRQISSKGLELYHWTEGTRPETMTETEEQ